MTQTRLTSADYYRTALQILGEHGGDALTIAGLGARLGVTKGSFYHHFDGMPGFVEGLMRYWEREHSELLIELSQQQPDPVLRVVSLRDLAIGLPHAPEAAIRAWAHTNPVVAAALASVDRRRDHALVDVYVALGIDPSRARLLAGLALTVLVGAQHRDGDLDPRRLRQLFDEVMRLLLRELDADLAARLVAAAG